MSLATAAGGRPRDVEDGAKTGAMLARCCRYWIILAAVFAVPDRPSRIKSEYRVEMPRPRDLRGVRKMPAFHQLSERIWRDIVAGA
jgi:ABC-type nitrate/sulfonate/bicarbonate transport system ATPase subunit